MHQSGKVYIKAAFLIFRIFSYIAAFVSGLDLIFINVSSQSSLRGSMHHIPFSINFKIKIDIFRPLPLLKWQLMGRFKPLIGIHQLA